jgi:hypothetical protein
MNLAELARVLEAMGCPGEKSVAMAEQLQRRASQLAKQKGRSEAEAMEHLLKLMSQGWAARERGGMS